MHFRSSAGRRKPVSSRPIWVTAAIAPACCVSDQFDERSSVFASRIERRGSNNQHSSQEEENLLTPLKRYLTIAAITRMSTGARQWQRCAPRPQFHQQIAQHITIASRCPPYPIGACRPWGEPSREGSLLLRLAHLCERALSAQWSRSPHCPVGGGANGRDPAPR